MDDFTGEARREKQADAREVIAEAREAKSDKVDTLHAQRETAIANRQNEIKHGIRFLKWLLAVLIVLSIGNFARTFVVQSTTDKATQAANVATAAANHASDISIEGRDAAVETLGELRAILARMEQNNEGEPDLSNQGIIDALQAIARIEGYLCGGQCPPP